MLEQILRLAIKSKASDIHLVTGEPPVFRIFGDMQRIESDKLTEGFILKQHVQYMSENHIRVFKEKSEVDFSFEIPGLSYFRVNMFRHSNGVSSVIRVIPSEVLTLNQIRAPEVFQQICSYPKGLVLVTGPTGSGKSTTLAAMINYINEIKADHILTVEDPIEFVHQSKKSIISQREVGRDTLSFDNALRAALREDPDIILVGEMRDRETIGLALTAAETGHLVFGTLHTQSAQKTIDRLVDVFPPEEKDAIRTMLSGSLNAVISQNLLKKADGSGRVAAHEIMICNNAIRNLIRENKLSQIVSIMQTGRGKGMQTMQQALEELVSQGLITEAAAAEKLATA